MDFVDFEWFVYLCWIIFSFMYIQEHEGGTLKLLFIIAIPCCHVPIISISHHLCKTHLVKEKNIYIDEPTYLRIMSFSLKSGNFLQLCCNFISWVDRAFTSSHWFVFVIVLILNFYKLYWSEKSNIKVSLPLQG